MRIWLVVLLTLGLLSPPALAEPCTELISQVAGQSTPGKANKMLATLAHMNASQKIKAEMWEGFIREMKKNGAEFGARRFYLMDGSVMYVADQAGRTLLIDSQGTLYITNTMGMGQSQMQLFAPDYSLLTKLKDRMPITDAAPIPAEYR